MADLDPNLQKHLEYNCYLQNTYSIDKSKNHILQNEIKSIYNINLALFIIYYLIVIVYIVLDYKNILFGEQIIKHSIFVLFLLSYPFIIFAIQHHIYAIISRTYNYVFQNIYQSKDY